MSVANAAIYIDCECECECDVSVIKFKTILFQVLLF